MATNNRVVKQEKNVRGGRARAKLAGAVGKVEAAAERKLAALGKVRRHRVEEEAQALTHRSQELAGKLSHAARAGREKVGHRAREIRTKLEHRLQELADKLKD